MTQILVLAYYFPPLGGAGVQRTVAFVRHLRAHGYGCVVVTGPEADGPDWAPADETLAHLVPSGTPVLRVPGPAPGAGSASTRRRARWLARPSPFARWWVEGALAAARPVLGDVALVYASMSPFETAAAAARLAREGGLPWVADLRDPWALDDWAAYPTALHRRLERRRMLAALADAAAVVANTAEATRALSRAAPELAGRLETIPNGWERDDFAGPAPARDDDAFRIVYTGFSHAAGRPARRGLLGGATPGIEVPARSHLPLEAALRRLREPGRRIELHVAGPARLDEPGAAVVDHGYLPHGEAVALMRSADLLYLAMHGLPAGVRTTTVPGKTYEYLAAGRPILAALPAGGARALLAGRAGVRRWRPGDVDCLARGVEAALAGELAGPPPAELLARFERRELTRRLAGVFDRVLAGRQPDSVPREERA